MSPQLCAADTVPHYESIVRRAYPPRFSALTHAICLRLSVIILLLHSIKPNYTKEDWALFWAELGVGTGCATRQFYEDLHLGNKKKSATVGCTASVSTWHICSIIYKLFCYWGDKKESNNKQSGHTRDDIQQIRQKETIPFRNDSKRNLLIVSWPENVFAFDLRARPQSKRERCRCTQRQGFNYVFTLRPEQSRGWNVAKHNGFMVTVF